MNKKTETSSFFDPVNCYLIKSPASCTILLVYTGIWIGWATTSHQKFIRCWISEHSQSLPQLWFYRNIFELFQFKLHRADFPKTE